MHARVIKTIVEPTVAELKEWISAHYEPSANDVCINIPSSADIDQLNVTKSGILKAGSNKEDFIYTVLSVGSEVKDFKSGDKLIIHGNLCAIVVNGYVVGQVSKHQVKGKLK